MVWLARSLRRLFVWWPVAALLIVGGLGLRALVYALFQRREVRKGEDRALRYAAVALLAGLWLVMMVLATPLSDATHGQLLSFLGILLSAAIALSSTTLMGNIVAGFMLRGIRSFRPGDFLTVGEHFGRVTETGLLHTEIQTETRDLTTIPNLFLVQHPVVVIQGEATVVAATVSLGYENSRREIEAALVEATADAGLHDGFVRVLELGDFSVRYRAAGFLDDVKVLLTTRSRLRGAMIERLHARNIEIVSPTFVNQRRFDKTDAFLHKEHFRRGADVEHALTPESRIFDKADAAQTREQVIETLESIDARVAELEAQKQEATAVELQRQIGREVTRLTGLKQQLQAALEPEAEGEDEVLREVPTDAPPESPG